jgi:BirA family biotin operon repressor/biotin-[acetyl-CoA-carboxylase] ligase
MCADLRLDALRQSPPGQVIGRELRAVLRAGSTNELAAAAARTGAPEGLVILADEQTAGRGRQGRGWVAPPGSSLLLSILLRPALAAAEAFALTMLAAVALCEAVEQAAQASAALKWPNDLMLLAHTADGPALRKAAGVLTELEVRDGMVAWAVVGIGVNVNWMPAGEVDGRDLAATATSVAAAAGRPVDRGALLWALLAALDGRYAALRREGLGQLFTAWRARLATLGQEVTVRLPVGEVRGRAEDVEPNGALIVREPSGARRRVLAGEVGG